MLDTVTLDTFAPLVGQPFRLILDDGNSVEATLTRATASPFPGWQPPENAPRRQPFVLHFVVPVEVVFPQRIYRFAHDTLGELEIFIVPIEQTARGVGYEAVFS
jgi:hypothetical protein